MPTSMDQKLEKGRILVYGVRNNASIMERIAPVYPEDRLQLGMDLYQAADESFNAQSKEKSEASKAMKDFQNLNDRAYQRLVRIRQVGRYFFKNEIELYTLLNLHIDIPTTFAEYHRIATQTVNAILQHESIQTKMTILDMDTEFMTSYQQELGQLADLKLTAEKEDGEAQKATVAKNEAYNAFMAYCKDLRECLKLFYFGNEAQVLEEVGIIVK